MSKDLKAVVINGRTYFEDEVTWVDIDTTPPEEIVKMVDEKFAADPELEEITIELPDRRMVIPRPKEQTS